MSKQRTEGRFAGQVVLVTGGAGGLGSAIAAHFFDEAACVVVADCDVERASVVAEQLGSAAYPMKLEVSDESSWVSVFDEIERLRGTPDVLVNNAGVFVPNVPFEQMSVELWRRHFAVNAEGTFLGCKHALLRMKARGSGAIVNMASGFALRPQATASAYCASKAAVWMTTRTAAAAAGPYGIRVNAVLPGAVPTDMLRGNLAAGDDEQAYFALLAQHAALGKLASAADIARAVAFLADPANNAITGVALPVDAGNLL
ncbi:MAG: SDR family oxidoreductase [Sinobacteraceae bacterium]|nr:SDR family oxidoreductase [Nevskiaceae bacterium]